MKSIVSIAFFLFFGITQAQWQSSFDSALDLAGEQDKPIVVVFSGSDWCAPCIRFKRKILDSQDFMNYAEEHYVLYNADFPRKKKNKLPEEKINSNKSLAQDFNPRGYFPLVVVLDKKKTLLGKAGFNTKASPEEFISRLNSFIK